MKINPGDGNAEVGDKSMPKDAQVMAAILRDMGIMEFEPRVINQVWLSLFLNVSVLLKPGWVSLLDDL